MLHISDYIVMVRSLVGCRYAHAGRSRDGGLDCIGAMTVPLHEMGVPHEDQFNYTREAFDESLAETIGQQLTLIPVKDREPGDLLLFWCNRRTRKPQHAAILVGPPPDEMIVHAYMPLGKVVESPMGSWKKRLTHCFRFPPTMLAR